MNLIHGTIKPSWLFLLLGMSIASCHSADLIAAAPGSGGKPSLAPILEKVLPTVANVATNTKITVEQNPLFSDSFFRRFFGIPDT